MRQAFQPGTLGRGLDIAGGSRIVEGISVVCLETLQRGGMFAEREVGVLGGLLR